MYVVCTSFLCVWLNYTPPARAKNQDDPRAADQHHERPEKGREHDPEDSLTSVPTTIIFPMPS